MLGINSRSKKKKTFIDFELQFFIDFFRQFCPPSSWFHFSEFSFSFEISFDSQEDQCRRLLFGWQPLFGTNKLKRFVNINFFVFY
jgi:hypothetical protein